ncbi:MFS transporter [Streptomyces sp. NPDC006798]|uniref:MFS transporter n=1 Tax=Streptomyces sp. NPDC006798 TaxID=3155462 RepID=UPI0033C63FAF
MVLSRPHVVRLLTATMVGRLPTVMAPIAVILLVTTATGSLATGGLLGAAYSLTAAVSQPGKGRLLDRYGPVRISGPGAVLHATALLALPHAVGAHRAGAVAAVVVAALTAPPLEAGLRAMWPRILADPGERRAAVVLDSTCSGLVFITGPLLTGALAAAHGPDAALTVAAVLGLAGTAGVLTSAPARSWHPAGQPVRKSGRLLTAWLGGLVAVLTGTGLATGAMNVWAVQLADVNGDPALTGLVPAVFSLGALAGSVLFASHLHRSSARRRLITGAAGLQAAWVVPLLAVHHHPATGVTVAAVAVPGLFHTVVTTSVVLTVQALAPAGRRAEAYAWLILAGGTGHALGTALAGALSTHPLGGPVLPALGAALTLAAAIRTLAHTAPGVRA